MSGRSVILSTLFLGKSSGHIDETLIETSMTFPLKEPQCKRSLRGIAVRNHVIHVCEVHGNGMSAVSEGRCINWKPVQKS